MSGIMCKCGNRVSYSDVPCKIQWLFMSEVEFDSTYTGSVDSDELFSAMKTFLKCPYCSRLIVFWEGESGEPSFYQLE